MEVLITDNILDHYHHANDIMTYVQKERYNITQDILYILYMRSVMYDVCYKMCCYC